MTALTIVTYHYVRPIGGSRYPNIKGLEIEGFRRQLDFLTTNYAMITPWQLIKAAKGETLPENACLLTFDDGYKDHFEFVFPELARRSLSGAFFPPAEAIEHRKMLPVNLVHMILACQTDIEKLIIDLRSECVGAGMSLCAFTNKWQELAKPSRYDPAEIVFVKRLLQHGLDARLREQISATLFRKYVSSDLTGFASEFYMDVSDCKELLAGNMYVGSHGNRHLWLEKETRKSQEEDIDESLRFLARLGATTCDWMLCFPYGSYNDDTLSVMRGKGAVIGLTTKSAVADTVNADFLILPRMDTNSFAQ
jgi:peptidoglycan/xylan/chitin deacetylase (PgdA/CDA1 family)